MRLSIAFSNIALLAGVGLVVAQTPSDSASGSSQPNKPQFVANGAVTKPLDELSSADVAVHVARVAQLDESTAVVNKADSVNAQLAISSADDQVLSKPQIVSTSLKSKKDIKIYRTVEGDTVNSIAAKFGITTETVRLSNGLAGDAVAPNKDLVISPVNGLVYTVKAGDTPESIASRYQVNKEQLIAFNDAELTGSFRVGERIVIPDAVQPADVRTAEARNFRGYARGFSFGSGPIYGYNGYDYGWCTWHAANRRIQIGNPIPSNLGNAITWLPLARKAGLPTGSEPRAGAVLYHKNIGGLGHVAFVEKVNSDGSMLVSDMNYPTWGRVTYRTVPPSEFGNYAFIY